MFYIALCDDNSYDLEITSEYIHELKKEHWQIEDLYINNGTELAEMSKNGRRFDLIVLDMCMEPMDGIETARIIRQFDPEVPIIILTSSVEYAIDGYKVNALRYLIKPVNKEEFLDLIKETLFKISRHNKKYFIFTNEDGLNKISLENIYYFESNIRTIYLIAKDGTFTFTGKISEVEEQLRNVGFVRTHKSYIVNLKHVSNIFKESIILENKKEILLSKHKRKEVAKQLLEYMEYAL